MGVRAFVFPLFSRTAHTGWCVLDEVPEYDEPELDRDELELLDELERLVEEELDERELLPLLEER